MKYCPETRLPSYPNFRAAHRAIAPDRYGLPLQCPWCGQYHLGLDAPRTKKETHRRHRED